LAPASIFFVEKLCDLRRGGNEFLLKLVIFDPLPKLAGRVAVAQWLFRFPLPLSWLHFSSLFAVCLVTLQVCRMSFFVDEQLLDQAVLSSVVVCGE
jgi:hypothetical protein